MTAWMDFLERGNPGYLRTRELGHNYNDWLAPAATTRRRELLATAYWAYDAALMAELADAAGRPDEAAGYRELRAKIGAAFADAFVAADGRVASGTQTAYVLGLHMGLIPADLRAAAAGHLVDAIRRRGLAPDHRLRRRRLPAAGAQRGRAHRRRLPAARAADVPLLAVHDRPGRDHDLGALGRLVRGARLPVRLDELVQPLLARLGRRVALPVRARHRPGAGRRRLRPAAAAPAPRRRAAPARAAPTSRCAAWSRAAGSARRPFRLPGGGPAERHRQRARAERRPRPGARRGWRRPAGVADYPGLRGAREAVFEVGSGAHEFSGPLRWASPVQ